MSILEFLAHWREAGGAERANKDSFLRDLCDAIGVERPRPTTTDPEKDSYVFERNVTRSREDGTSIGKIDLYRAGCFVLEAKQLDSAKRKTPGWEQAMNDAFGQALGYARSLPEPPPFVLVCDLAHCLDVYAAFDGSGHYRPFPDGQRKRLFFADLEAHAPFLRALWEDPLSLDPSRRQAKITREVAAKIAGLARELEAAGHDPGAVAEFLMRCLFTMFAEDVGLLPGKLFTKYLHEYWIPHPESFPGGVAALWRDMNEGRETVAGRLLRFNGGLFADQRGLALTPAQMKLLAEAAASDWASVDPSIFGTLLERALDPTERHRLGAHYTPRAYVERLVKPTIEEPLRADWDLVRAEVRQLVEADKVTEAQERVRDFHHRLCRTRVLDPACGTGNFLYVTLDLFKRLESEVLAQLEGLGYSQMALEIQEHRVTPEQYRGIEVKRWAKEIAELVLWIGYLQWQVRQTGEASTIPEPVLRDYGNIECRDAVLAWDGDPELARDERGVPITRWDGQTTKKSPVTGEDIPDESATIPVYTYKNPRPAEWPAADFIIGNPPYIGKLLLRRAKGDGYTAALRDAFEGLVANGSDYVMYWWHMASQRVATARARRAGLISTNTIWQTTNRRLVAEVLSGSSPVSIAFAIPDHPWVDSADGADVRVALSVVTRGSVPGKLCTVIREEPSGEAEVAVLFSERRGLIGSDFRIGTNLTSAGPLLSNKELSGTGLILGSRGFVLKSDEARPLLENGGAYATLLYPLRNGSDITEKCRDFYVIDTAGWEEAELRDKAPILYQRLLERVRPEREQNRDPRLREFWWLPRRSNEQVRAAIAGLNRYIATPETAKHRVFQFLDRAVLPEHKLVVVGSADSFHLAVLSSRSHSTWALASGGRLGVGNDPVYSKTRCFDPFAFPTPSKELLSRIRDLGERLDSHRKLQQGLFPKLTITGMYNVLEKLRSGEALSAKDRVIHEQGLVSVLKQIHDELDAAVFEAYGWPATLSDEEILERLVALNHERAEEEKRGLVRWLRPEFQNPGGAGAGVQSELPGTVAAGRKGKKGAKGRKGAAEAAGAAATRTEKRAWPKELPAQVAAVRDLLTEIGTVDLPTAKAAFKGAKEEPLRGALDSLAALGLAVSSDSDESRSWSALR